MSFEDIILKVKAHPELWLCTHQYYRNRAVCSQTWKQITKELDADEWTVKKRWKHLKDQYRKELKKILSKRLAMSNWHYYNDLSFITDEVLTGRHGVNKNANSNNVASENESDSDEQPLLRKKNPQQEPINRQPRSSDLVKRGLNAKKKPLIMKQLKELKDLIQSKNKTMDDELRNDADYLFLISLLPTIRKLSDLQKLHFRGKVNEWLLQTLSQYQFTNVCDNKIYVQDQLNESQP
ncbi:uncharacterized protein LOC126770231 [Nymphalis io]|uniref:uncharacterized protein LOC126770231 n=1 Tax=Inachis io TaxID=171585 RepID=UPI0021680CA6|nr:uncharacterized protein LOC126770231 [Nymphalis io]